MVGWHIPSLWTWEWPCDWLCTRNREWAWCESFPAGSLSIPCTILPTVFPSATVTNNAPGSIRSSSLDPRVQMSTFVDV